MLKNLTLRPSRSSVALSFFASLLLIALSCSSGGSDTPEPTKAPESAAPAPTAESAPTGDTKASDDASEAPVVEDVEPTEVPDPTAEPVKSVAPTATPKPEKAAEPTATPEPTSTPGPTATPAPLTNSYDLYGFTVELDQDASFATANLSVDGWAEPTADDSQGVMTFEYNGADVVIFWQPQDGDTPQDTIDLTYQLQQLGKPDLTFAALNEGDLAVDGENGRYVGYLTADASGGNAAGGLIGAWTCADSGTQMSLTATGPDSTALQIRFDRLTSGFSCATS